MRHAFGTFGKDVGRGLQIRCDWGPQYIADAWINEVKWLGISISPSYVGEPECNGVAERFIRTLKRVGSTKGVWGRGTAGRLDVRPHIRRPAPAHPLGHPRRPSNGMVRMQ